MRLFVTGGTGAIGATAVPALVAAGHEVRGLARSTAAEQKLIASGATPARVSLFDPDTLAIEFAGCDAVINLASALPSTASFIRSSAWTECEHVRTAGSAAVVDAALRAGVPRVIQESVVMIYRDQASAWIDESGPVDHYPIARGNHAAEASARRFGESGDGSGSTVGATILRFGLFYGRGATHSEQMLALARRGIGFVPGRAGTYRSSIHLADAATAVVAALDAPPGTYNIVDDEPVTVGEHADAVAAAAGRRRWLSGPGRAALLLGERTTSLTRSVRASNSRFRQASGWAPRFPSVWSGYREMVGDPA